jgi:hypothetical protein
MRILLVSVLLSSAVFAADAVTTFQSAMTANDAGAKKSAARTLASKDAGKDVVVLPLLIAAITDRQAGEAATSALQARTGKTPVGGVYKVGQDPALTQAAWQLWFEDWKKTQELKQLAKKDDPQEKTPEKPATVETPKGKAPTEASVPTAPAADLGKLDRINFKSGGSLLCFIQSKRTDADGNLLSVRAVHPDGSGEETIAADLISRIEEDIR